MNRDKQQDRENRAPSQKTMLSKALQKANAAVLLDNATNYEGAIDAYNDACQLLQHVMHHSGGHDEKQKLEEIVRFPSMPIILIVTVIIVICHNVHIQVQF